MLIGFVVVATSSIALGFWLGRSSNGQSAPGPSASSHVDPASRPPAPTSSPSERGLRPRIREAIERAPVRSGADLDAYLDSLEAQARRNRAVTALEIEPGMALIRRYSGDEDKVATFGQRMLRVQQELQGATAPPQPAPPETQAQLDALSSDITRAKDDAERQKSIRRYIDVAVELGPEQSLQAMERLNRIAGKDQQSDPAAADALWKSIEGETNERRRQDLIRDYLMLLPGLDDTEQHERIEKLQARFGSGSASAPTQSR